MFVEMLRQRSLDDCGTPLAGVEFCAVDLETTGTSPGSCAITEIGAVKVKRGEVTGTFQTLVNPGRPVPAFVRLLTGIGNELLTGAPPIDAVLPFFLEFSRGTVLVAHNARFDISFLNAALERCAYPRLANRVVDTATVARKVLAGEVPNRKLDTLARHLRCAHLPTHRAYADALATVDVLHYLPTSSMAESRPTRRGPRHLIVAPSTRGRGTAPSRRSCMVPSRCDRTGRPLQREVG